MSLLGNACAIGTLMVPAESGQTTRGGSEAVTQLTQNHHRDHHSDRGEGSTAESVADKIFLTGTAAAVTPIREIDHRTIGEGKRGPITEELQTAFFDIVTGKDARYDHWRSFL